MRIPFDIKYRDKIESGEYKVETRDGRPARIICWDVKGSQPILGLIYDTNAECETAAFFFEDGLYCNLASSKDLFIATPEPEMSEFEKALDDTIRSYRCDSEKDEDGGILDYQSWIKRKATSLLDLAKSQLLQSGELLTQEHHEKLMETLREECKKDLPRWRKCEKPFDSPSNCGYNGVNLINHGYALSIDDAYTKLPKDE